MLALTIVLTYFIVGLGLGRMVFVSTLGESKRKHQIVNGGSWYWTDAYTGAFWWMIGTVLAWPVFGPIRLLIMETPYEKNARLKVETAKMEKELEAFERQRLAQIENQSRELTAALREAKAAIREEYPDIQFKDERTWKRREDDPIASIF